MNTSTVVGCLYMCACLDQHTKSILHANVSMSCTSWWYVTLSCMCLNLLYVTVKNEKQSVY